MPLKSNILSPQERQRRLDAELEKVSNSLSESLQDVEDTPQSESEECLQKVEEVTKQIREEDKELQERLENIKSDIQGFFVSLLVFRFNTYVGFLYTKRYGNDKITDIINKSISEIKSISGSVLSSIDENKEEFNSSVSKIYNSFVESQLNKWEEDISSINPSSGSVDADDHNQKRNRVRKVLQDIIGSFGGFNVEYPLSMFPQVEDTNINLSSGPIFEHLQVSSREPNDQEVEERTYIENLSNEISDHFQQVFPSKISATYGDHINSAQIAYKIIRHKNLENDLIEQINQAAEDLQSRYFEIIDVYERINEKTKKEIIGKRLQQIECEGESILPSGEVPDSPEGCGVDYDPGFKGFSNQEDADVSKVAYWHCFAKSLNKVALAPKYFSTGIIVPSPGGPKRIDLPVTWIPMVTISLPSSVLVIWLTVNGVVVVPTIWSWAFPPEGNGESKHIQLFRGGNKTIKDDTATKFAGDTIVNGVDIDPEKTAQAPRIQDDIPPPERISIKNPQLIPYLNDWCDTAKPHMGLP